MRPDTRSNVGLPREATNRLGSELQKRTLLVTHPAYLPATVGFSTNGYRATAQIDPAPSRQRPGSWRTHLTTAGGNAL